MMMSFGLPAAGEMGAGIGRVLVENGSRVVASVQGRSEDTRRRASDAGIGTVDDAGLVDVDAIFSIVPPGFAVETAKRLAGHFRDSPKPPVYFDLNAISPQTMREVAKIVEAAGAQCVDGSIIGGPPVRGGPGPRIYLSGADIPAMAELEALGLDFHVMDGGIGAASALKMCYGGLTKGLTGLTAAVILAAQREGVGDDLHAELAGSQAALLKRAESVVPKMYPKAYRWVAEMEEISAFLGEGRTESDVWKAIAGLYARLAQDFEGDKAEIAALDAFLARRKET